MVSNKLKCVKTQLEWVKSDNRNGIVFSEENNLKLMEILKLIDWLKINETCGFYIRPRSHLDIQCITWNNLAKCFIFDDKLSSLREHIKININ